MAGIVRLLSGLGWVGFVAFIGCGRTELELGDAEGFARGGARTSSGGAGAPHGGAPRVGGANGGGNSFGGRAGSGSGGAHASGSGGGGFSGAPPAGGAGMGAAGSGGADTCDPACAPGEDCRAGMCVCQRPVQLLKVSPHNAQLDVVESSPVIATYSCALSFSGDPAQAMRLFGDNTGTLAATFPKPANPWQILLQPTPLAGHGAAFFPGERITGWIGDALMGPQLWQFWVAVRHGTSGRFENSGQALDPAQKVELGDLDRDGDLDALIWSSSTLEVLANDGKGQFALAMTGQSTSGPKLADLDGDGYLDIAGSQLWLNRGALSFVETAESLDEPYAVADFDGDGDQDVFSIRSFLGPMGTDWEWAYFANRGDGSFERRPIPGGGWPYNAQVGDFDDNGALDLALALGRRSSLLLNDGAGSFTEVVNAFEVDATREIAVGDLDGDGDLDLFTASWGASGGRNPQNRVWLNDGAAHFTAGSSPSSGSPNVVFGDLDGDGDLDAVAGQHDPYSPTRGQPSQVLINDGTGNFAVAGEVGGPNFQNVRLGDLDGDGDLDAFTTEWNYLGYQPAQVFLQGD